MLLLQSFAAAELSLLAAERRELYEKIRRNLIGKSEDLCDLLEEWMQKWPER